MTRNQSVRAIDHIGVTVPDLEAAARFLIDGLGAVLLFEALGRDAPPCKGEAVEKLINSPPRIEIRRICMYRLGNGPGIELFEYENVTGRREPLRGCDYGWQHIALYVDDINAAIERAVGAGAELLNGPWPLQAAEAGQGNLFAFLKAPFGALIEMVAWPSGMAGESEAGLRRWRPEPNDEF